MEEVTKNCSTEIDRALRGKILFHAHNGKDYYKCSCGHLNKFSLETTEEERFEFKTIKEQQSLVDDDGFSDIIKFSDVIQNDRACKKCKKDFKDDAFYGRILNSGEFLTTVFKTNDNDDFLELAVHEIRIDFSKGKKDFSTKSISHSLRISKKDNSIWFLNEKGESREADLDEIYKTVGKFFDINTKSISGIIELHIFVSKLASFVSDSDSINIFNGLISELSNKAVNVNNQEVFKKIITIFLAIIKYSNLSTIAMIKGPIFLYEMIVECDIPKPSVLIENKVTSPIKIFNFLVKNYIKKISGEINSDNKSAVEFKFKSKKFSSFVVRNEYNSRHVKNGEISISNINGDGQISKLIFNKIQKFSDYKGLINFMKFISYDELIYLVQNYDVEFLVEFMNLIYFRNNTSFENIKKLIPIVISYCKKKEYEVIINYDESYINYSNVKNFSFIEYDDSRKMLLMLKNTIDKEDERGQHVIKKALKEFARIKTYEELVDFHDELNTYYKGVADPQKNSEFRKFASQFRFLEEKDEKYNGPLEIQIIATPDGVIKEGWEMKHSAPAYIDAVVENRYLMCKVFDRSEDVDKDETVRFTLGLDYSKNVGLTFDQVKGFANKIGSNRFKKLMMEYLEAKDISYQPIRDLKLEIE